MPFNLQALLNASNSIVKHPSNFMLWHERNCDSYHCFQAGNVEKTEKTVNAFIILMGNLTKRDHLRDKDKYKRTISKWILTIPDPSN
jgi:hypothetical protein